MPDLIMLEIVCIFFLGEYKLQHSRQLGQPCQRGTQLSVLWKNFLLEGSPGETHRDATQGSDKDFKADIMIERKKLCPVNTFFLDVTSLFSRLARAMAWRGSQ